jgi:Zn-dependent M28 family amino/carboxypeptidase
VRSLLRQRLGELGFQVEEHAYGSGTNVVGTLPGKSAEQVIVSAHYDHIERCAGADDNASGMAAALELARALSRRARVRPLVLAFWDEEERGLKGSLAYANRSRARKEPIAISLSFDAIGVARRAEHSQQVPAGFATLLPEQAALLAARGYRGDFIALVANPSAGAFSMRLASFASELGLPTINLEVSALQAAFVPDLFRSDHAAFWFADYPGLLLTDTAELRNPSYHCLHGSDVPATLDYEFLTRVTSSATAAVAEALQANR